MRRPSRRFPLMFTCFPFQLFFASVPSPAHEGVSSQYLRFQYQVGVSAFVFEATGSRMVLSRASGLESFSVSRDSCFRKDYDEIKALIAKRVQRRMPIRQLAVADEDQGRRFAPDGSYIFSVGEQVEQIDPRTSFGRFLRDLLSLMETSQIQQRSRCGR